ncbi:hypothetical protein M413DRAFT_75409, partial [Hebeloma cylindrosporum]
MLPPALSAVDGLVACEFTGKLRYQVPGLRKFGSRSAPLDHLDDNGHDLPTHYFITSPNMTTIPDISQDSSEIQVRRDGRFGPADFTLFPQWYAEGTRYLPFVLRKPAAEDMEYHQYALIWYSMSRPDFVLESGSVVGGLGRLSPALANAFATMRKDLMAQIQEAVLTGEHTPADLRDLKFCERGMQFASISLLCAPQSYEGVLLTVTSFQRYFLETLACFDYMTIWKTLPPNEKEQPRPTSHVMGTLTCDIEKAVEFFDMGIPVWLVRHPQDFPPSTIIRAQVFP